MDALGLSKLPLRRMEMKISKLLSILLGVLVLVPSSAMGKVPFTDNQVRTFAEKIKADGNAKALDGLSQSEAQYVVDRGLKPVEAESSGGRPSDLSAKAAKTVRKTRHKVRAHAAYYRTWDHWCASYSGAGIRLWKYHSNWQWNYSLANRKVLAANHQEYSTDQFFGYSYQGRIYLWASGGIGSSYVGRATQGSYSFLLKGIGYQIRPILDVHVNWDGSSWLRCSGY